MKPDREVSNGIGTQYHLVRWLLRRLMCCGCTAILTALSIAIAWEYFGSRLLESRAVIPGGFLLNWNLTLRWGRIWAFGCGIGLLIPDATLPTGLTRILLGGLFGIPVGIIAIGLLDSLIAERLVSLAYAPFGNVKLPLLAERPLPGQKFYPSVFRQFFLRGVIGGIAIGALSGGTCCLTGRKRRLAIGAVCLVAVGFFVQTWSVMMDEFDGYVRHRQDFVRRRLEE